MTKIYYYAVLARRKTKIIKLGNLSIGDKYPIYVQGMTKTSTSDITSTIKQIKKMENVGCEIVRVAVKNTAEAKNLKKIKENIKIPLVADIQYNFKVALSSIEHGADGIRINPGNISPDAIKKIAKIASEKNTCVRIGTNSGSINPAYLRKYKGNIVDALVMSCLDYVSFFEDENFTNMKISLKATSIKETYFAYQKMAKLIPYPFHIGITEAGTYFLGAMKSAIGIGALLLDGIGDTIRVSLTDTPQKEIEIAYQILNLLEIRKTKPIIISCPTCGRCEINLIKIAKEVEKELHKLQVPPIRIAIMGCSVNGPGEARECDIGIAGGKNCGILFKKGKVIKKIKEEFLINELIEGINEIMYNNTKEAR